MLKYCILAFLLVGFAHSTSFEETADCLKGPEFWCKSISNSKQCGAFKHCLQTVWSRHTVYLSENVVTNDKSCDACTDCIKGDLRRCPNVELHLHEITELYLAKIPTKSICKLADACRPPAIEENVLEQPLEVKQTPQCVLCEFVITTLVQYVNQNSSSAEVTKWLDYVCTNVLPVTIRSECKAFVDEYEPVIIALISKQIDPDKICHTIGLCSKPFELTMKSEPESPIMKAIDTKSSTECAFCEFAMGAVVKLLSENSSSVEVQKALDYLCTHVMPETIRSECKAFVDQYEPVIVALLVKPVDADKICQLLGLCPKNQKVLLEPKFEITQSAQCVICEFVLTTLEKYISQNATGAEVQKWLEYV